MHLRSSPQLCWHNFLRQYLRSRPRERTRRSGISSSSATRESKKLFSFSVSRLLNGATCLANSLLLFFGQGWFPFCCLKGRFYFTGNFYAPFRRWSRGHKARGQGHKKIQGQGQPYRWQTLSRPRTQAHVLSKKRSSEKIFRRSTNF